MAPELNLKTLVPNPGYDGVMDVSPTEVQARAMDFCLIDVRNPDEWIGELGHAAGSIKIPLNELPQRHGEIPKDKPLVCICRTGNRSARAAAFLLGLGRETALNMSGGMVAWNELGFPVEKK